MSSASSPRSLPAADPEIARLSDDPADEDANAAPTKVGPMSKAFVDQMMFKAQLAESSKPPSRPPVSDPPASGKRSRAASAAPPAAPVPRAARANANLVVLNADEEGLAFEPTQLASAATAPSTPPSARNIDVRAMRFPTPRLAFPPAALTPPASPETPWMRRKSARRTAFELALLGTGLLLIAIAIALSLFH